MSVGFFHISRFASPLQIQLEAGSSAKNVDGIYYNPAACH
jgi:hypothetical protein